MRLALNTIEEARYLLNRPVSLNCWLGSVGAEVAHKTRGGPDSLPYEAIAICDGSHRYYDGQTAVGVMLVHKDPTKKATPRLGRVKRSSNNVAEYQAVIEGLRSLDEAGYKHGLVLSDSQLVCRQVSGRYRCKTDHLRPYLDRVHQLLGNHELYWVRRDHTGLADKLARLAQRRPNTAPINHENHPV